MSRFVESVFENTPEILSTTIHIAGDEGMPDRRSIETIRDQLSEYEFNLERRERLDRLNFYEMKADVFVYPQ